MVQLGRRINFRYVWVEFIFLFNIFSKYYFARSERMDLFIQLMCLPQTCYNCLNRLNCITTYCKPCSKTTVTKFTTRSCLYILLVLLICLGIVFLKFEGLLNCIKFGVSLRNVYFR